MKIPFFKTVLSEDAIQAVEKVLRSGWLTTGQYCQEFEDKFATFVGGDVQAVAVNSATSGLHLALEAIGIQPGDEVIVPTLTFTASAEAAAYLGAKVVLVDVDPTTLCADISRIKDAITDRTKAVVFVHFGGFPADIKPLLNLCTPLNIKVIEDAAHAIPARRNGTHIGTHGAAATVFSFYANKTMTTGEGGMIVTPNADIAGRCRLMRTHGINRDSFSRFNGKSDQWRYDVVEAGYKYNLTDIAAALGISQLAEVEELRQGRAHAATLYDRALKNLPIIRPPHFLEGDEHQHAWHLYPIQFEGGREVRDRVIAAFADHNIGYSVHYTPLHKLTFWAQNSVQSNQSFTVSDAYFDRCLSLPLFPNLSEPEIEHIVSVLTDVLNG